MDLDLNEVPVIICEAEDSISKQTKKLLNEKGFDNLLLYKDTTDLIADIEFVNEQGGAVLIIGLSESYSIPSLETAQIIKQSCPNIMVIGSGININNKFSISIMALQNGCDSWVEKNKKDYSRDIIKKVKHWSKYIKARNKLTDLCIVV